MDGFYAAYLTGREGHSQLMIAIRNMKLVGVDVGGIKYTGKLEPKDGGYRCEVHYTIPAGTALITGPGPVASAVPVDLIFDLPANFGEGPFVAISTPLGPLNASFKKLSDMDI